MFVPRTCVIRIATLEQLKCIAFIFDRLSELVKYRIKSDVQRIPQQFANTFSSNEEWCQTLKQTIWVHNHELIALERMIELFEKMLQHQFIKPSGEIPVVNLVFNINNYQQGVAVGMLFAYKKAVVETNWDCSDHAMSMVAAFGDIIPDAEIPTLFEQLTVDFPTQHSSTNTNTRTQGAIA